jgi:glycosyltransferase involved in cell wall biosynthesis
MASITIITPGFSGHAVGGYKVVYEYANFLVAQGHSVTMAQMRPAQLRGNGSVKSQIVRAAQYRIGRTKRPSWFALDPRVSVINYPTQIMSAIPHTDAVVATAMETADFAKQISQERDIPGAYFIQHYEDWMYGTDLVDATWRLPLQKLVIAPWLAEKGTELGVSSILVRNAIDSSAFPAGPTISERPLQVLALASDLEWKRTDLIAEVMTSVASRVPSAQLRVFGTVERPQILPADVQYFQSPSPEILRGLYQSSRVFVCASDAEGSALPPGEAMSSRTAVVSTDIGGVRVYADGVALFSPRGDSDALAANVIRLLTDEAECEHYASAGLARILGYTPDDAAAVFERELLELISAHSSMRG